MKKLLLLLALLGTNYWGWAQAAYFSTDKVTYCDWDNANSEFINCNDSPESTLFKLNSDETMFHHTTEDLSSSYYVQSKEYDKKTDTYSYKVKSDVGNEYTFIVDLKNEKFSVVGVNRSGGVYLLRHHIKRAWTD